MKTGGEIHREQERMRREKLAERRERIATAALQGMLSADDSWLETPAAIRAVRMADALIAELDKEPTP